MRCNRNNRTCILSFSHYNSIVFHVKLAAACHSIRSVLRVYSMLYARTAWLLLCNRVSRSSLGEVRFTEIKSYIFFCYNFFPRCFCYSDQTATHSPALHVQTGFSVSTTKNNFHIAILTDCCCAHDKNEVVRNQYRYNCVCVCGMESNWEFREVYYSVRAQRNYASMFYATINSRPDTISRQAHTR